MTHPTPPTSDATGRLSAAWRRHGRIVLTLTDQGLVSVASFATNFLLLHHFRNDPSHFASYTLAFNLMIWAAEFQATLVFTPHTIRSPRLSGDALRRFHGSTLLQSVAVSLITAVMLLSAAVWTGNAKPEMSGVLLVLGLGTLVIGLRNYARPYSFTAKRPLTAVLLDLSVAVLQIGGVLLLKYFGVLQAWNAVAVVAGASAVPAVVWLWITRQQFRPSPRQAVRDLCEAWPQTKWVFLSGVTWSAGMLLYPWLLSGLCDDRAVATWGACYTLACVANPLLMGLQNFIGPRVAEAVTELRRTLFRAYVYRIALGTAAMMALPAVVLSIWADTALSWLTRGAYTGQHVTITLLCAALVVQAITFTLSRGLFALHRADLDLYCNSLPLLTLFTVGIAAVRQHGVTGAAASLLIAQILSAGSRAVLFARAVRDTPPPSHEFDTLLSPAKAAV
ncbi:MAG TPA: hypothetical protein VF595_01390 [Tepidisphaeraceae bacterium]